MSHFPDFISQGYQVEKTLGSNRAGGRVTYLAKDIRIQQPVVIKQFQFARVDASWSDYDAYDREIQVLRGLDHPGIPRYLDCFQTEAGFCMVQEYKNASSLRLLRSFSPSEIQHIATSILKILAYLQNRIPVVIHRDIKPDNILVDDQVNVYLVDFGFARIGDGEIGVSSVVKGTLGFMPPEQLFNRQLTEASDLYGLGMTLLCLLTGTQSDEIGNLVDISYQIKFKHLVPKLSLHWVEWIEKMVEPRLQDRFPNASAALQAIPANPIYSPEIQFSQTSLDFRAKRLGQKLTQSITLNNLVSEVTLKGTWEVEPHPNDPPSGSGSHVWISFQPETFESNQAECQITVNTNKLMAGERYVRQLRLHTNGFPETYSFPLQVKTAPIPIKTQRISYHPFVLLFLFTLFSSRLVFWSVAMVGATIGSSVVMAFGTAIGSVLGLEVAAWTMAAAGAPLGAIASTIASVVVGIGTLTGVWVLAGTLGGEIMPVAAGAGIGLVAGWIIGTAIGLAIEKFLLKAAGKDYAIGISLLTASLAAILGVGFTIGLQNPLIIIAIACTGVPLVSLLLHLPLRRTKVIANYRRSERHLVRP